MRISCSRTFHASASARCCRSSAALLGKLTAGAADRLLAAGVACVGIDTLNIDATEGTGERPVHTTLLRNEIPIIEHLTGLDALPTDGFTFTSVPPKIEGAGTFTVRAFATIG